MKLSIQTRLRICFAGAIFALLVMAELMAVTDLNIRHVAAAVTCLCIGFVGLALWLSSVSQRIEEDAPEFDSDTSHGELATAAVEGPTDVRLVAVDSDVTDGRLEVK
jgi:hypothetical protein